jgi:hypothetical protein
MSPRKRTFLAKLNAMLLKKTNKKMLSAEDSILHAQEVHVRPQRGRRVRSQFSAAQLAANACADGEGCAGVVGLSSRPKMIYQPSTGNWDVVSAGNPDWIWHHIMQRAQARDQAGLGARPPRHARRADGLRSKAPVQMLAQLRPGVASDAEMGKQTLLLKLKALLRDKIAAGEAEPVQPTSSQSIMEVAAGQSSPESGAIAEVKKLSLAMNEGHYLARHSGVSDLPHMERLERRLATRSKLGEMCRHRHLVEQGLGVLKDMSLAGCEREVFASMKTARTVLRARIGQLRGQKAQQVLQPKSSLPVLQAKKQHLATELAVMQHQHEQLKAELAHQKERITQLTEKRRAQDSVPTPPRAAMDAAGALTQAAGASKMTLRRDRRSAPTVPRPSGAMPWSPPVPSGLPPGYKGQLEASPDTDVPHESAPGVE